MSAGTFNVAGPASKQTLEQFLEGLRPLARTPVTYVWLDDYEWLKRYPLRKNANGSISGYTYSVPWVMSEGDALGHTQISNRKAIAAGLKFRPLLTTARDTIAWRESAAVPEALRQTAALRPHARSGADDSHGLEGPSGSCLRLLPFRLLAAYAAEPLRRAIAP